MAFLNVTLAHMHIRLHVAHEIIGFLSMTHTYIYIHPYIHTYKLFSKIRYEILGNNLFYMYLVGITGCRVFGQLEVTFLLVYKVSLVAECIYIYISG